MRFSRHLFLLTLILLSGATTVSGQTIKAGDKIHDSKPTNHFLQRTFWDSLPKPAGYINDYENIFSSKEEQSLDSLIRNFEKRTTIQIAVITLDTTMTTPDSLDALTLRIARYWGVGRKDKNNGVTIGISKGYRRMRIENGYGIQKILTDAETKQIIDTVFIPSFRNAKYFEGTFKGLTALMAKLEENNK